MSRLVVVTGAGSGVGLATARMLLNQGDAVVGVDLAPAPNDPADVEWIQGDVASPDTWDRVDAACTRLDPGGADALAACAGTIVVAPFLQTPIDDWRRLLEANVLGVVRGMQALMPAMIARRRGAIAVVCSVNSFTAEDEMSAYSTSKAALLHAVRSAAIEYAHAGVRINAVCPGAIDTPLLQRHLDTLDDPEGTRRAIERRTPGGRILRPEEIASVLGFLLSDGASGMSGAAITVDGGLTATYEFDSARDPQA